MFALIYTLNHTTLKYGVCLRWISGLGPLTLAMDFLVLSRKDWSKWHGPKWPKWYRLIETGLQGTHLYQMPQLCPLHARLNDSVVTWSTNVWTSQPSIHSARVRMLGTWECLTSWKLIFFFYFIWGWTCQGIRDLYHIDCVCKFWLEDLIWSWF